MNSKFLHILISVITIILVQCTARVSLTKHDYDDFDPNMDETNEPVWMFSRVPILRNGPDFYEINNMIRGKNRVDGLSNYDFYIPLEDKKTIQKPKSEISQPKLNILDMEEYKGVPEVLRANKKPKFNRPSDLSGTNQLSPDVYKEFDELKEENYEKLKNKLFNPSGFMKTRIWISRAFKILRAIMKVIAEIKAIMQS